MVDLHSIFTKIVVECVDRLPAKRWPKHPIDAELGIETSKRVPPRALSRGRHLDAQSIHHLGVQPSILRNAIRSIEASHDAIFIDIGSGMGRALIVAGEFPFKSLIGYELYPYIANIARKNIAKVNLSNRVAVVESDASKPALPERGEVVMFLYNPFKGPVVAALMNHIENHLGKTGSRCKLWIIYMNPLCYELFDACKLLQRYAAEKVYYEEGERAGAPAKNAHDSYVIYQSAPFKAPLASANALVKVTRQDYGADVIPA